MSDRLHIGAAAPQFQLTDDAGRDFLLSQLRGHRVIVYFYPAAMTPDDRQLRLDYLLARCEASPPEDRDPSWLGSIGMEAFLRSDVLAGHRDLLDQLPGFHDPGAHNILRDLYDRLSLTSQQLDSVREMVSNALDLYVSAVSNRLNEIMKVLTIVATFFLPLTFITGFFGQNFGWMVEHVRSREAFLILGPGIAIVFVVALFATFVHAGFITLGRPSRAAARDRRAAARRAPG